MAESSDLSEWPRSARAERTSLRDGTAGHRNRKTHFLTKYADVVELVDSLDLGSNAKSVQVRVLSSAPRIKGRRLPPFFFIQGV